MKRVLLTMAVLLTLAIGSGLLWSPYLIKARYQGDGGSERAEGRVTTGDGRLSFDIPRGWVKGACPRGAPVTCLRVSPGRAWKDDFIMLSVFRPVGDAALYRYYTENIPAGTPAYSHFTMNGMHAIRIDSEQLSDNEAAGSRRGFLMMAGPVPADDTEEFLMSCEYRSRRAEVRAGCDSVAGSLRVRR